MRNTITITLLIVTLFISGCGGSGQLQGVYPVQGKITCKGEPVGQVIINLYPVNPGAAARMVSAASEENGTFVLSTLKPRDGAFPGEYKITLSKRVLSLPDEEIDRINALNQEPNATSMDMIPEQYTSEATTSLTFTVVKGKNNLVIDIPEDLNIPPYKWWKEKYQK